MTDSQADRYGLGNHLIVNGEPFPYPLTNEPVVIQGGSIHPTTVTATFNVRTAELHHDDPRADKTCDGTAAPCQDQDGALDAVEAETIPLANLHRLDVRTGDTLLITVPENLTVDVAALQRDLRQLANALECHVVVLPRGSQASILCAAIRRGQER